MTSDDSNHDDFPRCHEWEDYFDGHGVSIKRRFVELANDAHWVYRAECEAADLSVQAQTVENTLAILVETILREQDADTEADS